MKNQERETDDKGLQYRSENGKAIIFLNAVLNNRTEVINKLIKESNINEKKEILNSIFYDICYEDTEGNNIISYKYALYNIAVINRKFDALKKILNCAVETGDLKDMINSYNQFAFNKAKEECYIEIVDEISRYINIFFTSCSDSGTSSSFEDLDSISTSGETIV